MSVNLFVYGSLLNEKVLDILLKRKIENFPAVLKGYHRFCVRDAPYPAISLRTDGIVDGKILLIKENEKKLLDDYEGPDYICVDVTPNIQTSFIATKVLVKQYQRLPYLFIDLHLDAHQSELSPRIVELRKVCKRSRFVSFRLTIKIAIYLFPYKQT
jgi:gamma-glutamylcyclotransferase (GGCT)/AIG2-like uncharacterized protein YtfP